MKIDLARDTAITLAAWITVIGFLFVLSAQIEEVRADIKNLQQDNREMRQILISHLEFHADREKVSSVDGQKTE